MRATGDLADRARADGTDLRHALRRVEPAVVTLESRAPLDEKLLEEIRSRLTRLAGKPLVVNTRVDHRLETSISLRIGGEGTIDLDPSRSFLTTLEQRMRAQPTPTTNRVGYVSTFVAETEPSIRLEDSASRGWVRQVGDGVAFVHGLRDVRSQEVVRFQGGTIGLAFNLLESGVGCLLLGPESAIGEGSVVERTEALLHVPVGDALVGRVVDALGNPLDDKGPIVSSERRPVEALAPGVVQRAPVSQPLHTGLKIIDALVPLGRGQRELVLGDRKIGKTTLAIDAILSQRDSGVVCVYVAIGQKASSLVNTISLLTERGAMDYTIVVAAPASDPPGFRYVAPYTACTMAEDFMRRRQHALVIYDDLSKHAVTYREISALLQRPIGREAYPGDIFHVHSRLLERAACMRDDLGGGSLTAIPIVETLAGDISGLIPTNVISICDGQIFLDTARFNEGTRPAMDVGLSVSRVGGMAQCPAMRRVAGRLRIDLAQHHEMARFVKFGAEVDESTLRQLARGERELAVLEQDAHSPLAMEREVAVLYAAVSGLLDDVPVPLIRPFEDRLLAFLDEAHADLLKTLRETGELTTASEQSLTAAIVACRNQFLDEHRSATPSTGATV